MLTDVTFPIFAPSNEWNKVFEETNYDTEKTNLKCGSPFVSNQDVELKVRDGVYYTGLNPSSWFKEAGLNVYSEYSNGYDEAFKAFNYREEHGLEWISLYDIACFYKIAMFGSIEHVEYGLCDNEEQILKKWPHLEKSKQRHFITMTPIYKKHQPEHGGFRWHKWGEYIGEHDAQYEYLYDEKDIEVVYVFHIYTLKEESGTGSMEIEMVS